MTTQIRAQRIAERIREELTEILLQQITDPRLTGVTITDVTVDREIAYAKIFISTLEGSVRKKEVLSGFESAKGFLRFQLAQRIELRTFPQLRFKWDSTPEKAERIEKLISSLSQSTTPAREDNPDRHE